MLGVSLVRNLWFPGCRTLLGGCLTNYGSSSMKRSHFGGVIKLFLLAAFMQVAVEIKPQK